MEHIIHPSPSRAKGVRPDQRGQNQARATPASAIVAPMQSPARHTYYIRVQNPRRHRGQLIERMVCQGVEMGRGAGRIITSQTGSDKMAIPVMKSAQDSLVLKPSITKSDPHFTELS